MRADRQDARQYPTLPAYSEARIDSADLTDVQPAEYRADLVVPARRRQAGPRNRGRGAARAEEGGQEALHVAGLRREPPRPARVAGLRARRDAERERRRACARPDRARSGLDRHAVPARECFGDWDFFNLGAVAKSRPRSPGRAGARRRPGKPRDWPTRHFGASLAA